MRPLAWRRAVFVVVSAVLSVAVDAGAASPPERVVAVNSAAWMPYAFRDADGEPRGVLIDLWRDLAEEAGVEIRFELVTWRRSLSLVASGEVDLHAGLTRSPARAADLDFSAPLFRVRTQLFARRGTGIRHLAGVHDAPVGVVDGTVEQRFIADYYAGVRTRAFATSAAMVEAAVAGDIDVFVADYPTGHYRLVRREAIDRFEAVDTLYTDAIRAAVPKGEAALLAFVDDRIAGLDPAATQAILDRWLVPRERLPSWVWPTLGGICGGMALSTLAIHYAALQRTVQRRTRELRTTVDALSRANAELERRAHVDPLTGIANRHRFLDQARRAIERARRCGRPAAIALFDLDRLKAINDRYGHLVGDEALTRVARTLAAGVRESDLVARWGGDEFVVLLPETDEAAAATTAARLRRDVADEVVRVDGEAVSLGVSAGVAGYTAAAGGIEGWLRAADAALYADKPARAPGSHAAHARRS